MIRKTTFDIAKLKQNYRKTNGEYTKLGDYHHIIAFY